jgi:hypothetical protein
VRKFERKALILRSGAQRRVMKNEGVPLAGILDPQDASLRLAPQDEDACDLSALSPEARP